MRPIRFDGALTRKTAALGTCSNANGPYHPQLANPLALIENGAGATALFRAAEAAIAARDMDAAFVVCPAGWLSKAEMLEAAGYETAMVWSIKR